MVYVKSAVAEAVTADNGVVKENPHIAGLTATKAIAAYTLKSSPEKSYIYVIDSTGDVLSYGTEVLLYEGTPAGVLDVVRLSDTTALVVFYYNAGSGLKTYGAVATVSGTTVSLGTKYLIFDGYGSSPDTDKAICMLTSTKALVVGYTNTSPQYGNAVIVNISGSTLSVGTVNTFKITTGGVAYLSIAKRTDSSAVVSYTTSAVGYVRILNVSADVITAATEYGGYSGEYHFSLAEISDTKMLMGTRYQSGPYAYPKMRLLSLGSTTISISGQTSLGVEYMFSSPHLESIIPGELYSFIYCRGQSPPYTVNMFIFLDGSYALDKYRVRYGYIISSSYKTTSAILSQTRMIEFSVDAVGKKINALNILPYSVFVKVNGVWEGCAVLYSKNSGTWTKERTIHIRSAGTWQEVM